MDQLRQLVAAAFMVLGAFLIFYFLALFAWQIYRWLDSGVWVSLPASLMFANLSEIHAMGVASSNPVAQKNVAVLVYLPEFQRTDWMNDPKEWIGIHKIVTSILKSIHIGFLSAVLGVVCIAIGGNFAEKKRVQDETRVV